MDYLRVKFPDITTRFVRGLDLLLSSEVDTRVLVSLGDKTLYEYILTIYRSVTWSRSRTKRANIPPGFTARGHCLHRYPCDGSTLQQTVPCGKDSCRCCPIPHHRFSFRACHYWLIAILSNASDWVHRCATST